MAINTSVIKKNTNNVFESNQTKIDLSQFEER